MSVPQMREAFQIAYVTNDLDRAAGVLRDRFGCGEVLFMRDLPGAIMDLALSYSGTTNYELIEPHAASGDFYSDWIADADGFVMRFHHLGFIAKDKAEFAAIRAAHDASGAAIPLEASNPGQLDVFYADARDTLGHYLEYFWLDKGGRQLFAAVPDSPMTV